MRLFWQTILFWTLLSGCNPPARTVEYGGSLWVKDARYPICKDYKWYVEPPVLVQEDCQVNKTIYPYELGCAFVDNKCIVVSMYDEATADKVFILGSTISHRKHELYHIFNQLRHP